MEFQGSWKKLKPKQNSELDSPVISLAYIHLFIYSSHRHQLFSKTKTNKFIVQTL